MNEARQQMLERVGEDESLTGDLAGDAAEQLRQWANDIARTIAQRDDLDDETVQQYIKAVRTAARKAATQDGNITVAQRELVAHIGDVPRLLNAPISAVASPVDESTHSSNDVATPAIQPHHMTPASPSVSAHPHVWGRLRGWWRGMWGRTPKEE
jgi:type IV secretory pathway VirJ component